MHSLRQLYRTLLLLVFISFSANVLVYAQQSQQLQQSLSQIDFSKIKVDQLSDQQIESFIKEAQAKGLSISDVEQIALSKGMPASEIAKLKSRIEQIQSGTNLSSTSAIDSLNNRYQTTNPLQELLGARKSPFSAFRTDTTDTTQHYASMIDSLAANGKVFGFKLFNTQNLTFAPSMNIPTPSNYQLGVGDELVINIWGAAQMTYQKTISPDGTIQISNLGPIYLNGLSIDQAKKRIIKRLSEIYSGLSPDNPQKRNTYAEVSLGSVRSINVTLVGDVRAPGTYTIPSLSTVFNALYVSGGPDENGSFRSIQVIRNNKIIDSLDVYDFLVNGSTKNNIQLHDQDIIKINPYSARVYISGQVKRPLVYEVEPNETLADVIRFAGGFLGNAYTNNVTVIRKTPTEKEILDVTKSQFSDFKMKNGDEIQVGKILNRFSNLVQITGAVYRPGSYQVTDTSTVYGLIAEANGIKGDAYLPRALIYRKKPDQQLEIIPFNLGNLIDHPSSDNIKLKKDDIVIISSLFDLKEPYYVKVMGDVQKPDTLDYMDNMTLNDAIMEAGGFKESAAASRIEIARRTLNDNSNKNDNQIARIYSFSTDRNLQLNSKDKEFKLKPFDEIYVFSEPNYEPQQNVTVSGQVMYPGKYAINSKTETISDIINRAGGLTSQAYPQGATIVRKSKIGLPGSIGIDLPKILEYPNSKYDLMVMPGDSLYVPKRLQTVKVEGQVMYATNVRYDQSLGFKDYINLAGGYNDNALKKNTYVVYPNGEVDHIRKFLFFHHHPKIEPGSRIVVPAKPKQTGLSPQERVGIISAIVSMTASVATTIAIIARYL